MSSDLVVLRGTSIQRDPVAAAQELFDALNQPDICLAVFFCAPEYDRKALASALKERFSETLLIGCTTAGEITPDGYLTGSLTGFSLGSREMRVTSVAVEVHSFDSEQTAITVGEALGMLCKPGGATPSASNTFGVLLVDGLSMQEERVVSCLHRALNGIDLIGGSAGDAERFEATHIYMDGEFRTGVALLTLVHTNLPFLAFRTQHFEPTKQRMVVTKADVASRRVIEINGLPAASEYARAIGLVQEELTPLVFACHPVTVQVGGDNFIRSIGLVLEDGSLQFFCAIDEGLVLRIAKGVDMVSNLELAFERVREIVGEPQLVLGCDCLFRRLEADRDGTRERIGEIFAANNVVGFASYGEQFNAMHVNQTFTGIAIGRPKTTG